MVKTVLKKGAHNYQDILWSLRIEWGRVELLRWSGGDARTYEINEPEKYIKNGVQFKGLHQITLNGNILEYHEQNRFFKQIAFSIDLTDEEVELVKKAMTDPLKSEYKSNSEINEPIDTTSWKQGGK